MVKFLCNYGPFKKDSEVSFISKGFDFCITRHKGVLYNVPLCAIVIMSKMSLFTKSLSQEKEMDELDLAAEREGQAIRTVRKYIKPLSRRSHVISRQNVSRVMKKDFMKLLTVQQNDVQA